MHTHTFPTRKRTQAPSQSMRGVATLCAGTEAGLAWRRSGRVDAMYPWCDSQTGSVDFGNPAGGGPA
jgi:hypothetical protein